MKKKFKIILAIAIGFAVAMAIMAIAIYFGYTKAYSTDAEALPVSILGLPIYQLTKSGAAYVGEAKGAFMGAFCGICMAISVAAEEIITRIRKK